MNGLVSLCLYAYGYRAPRGLIRWHRFVKKVIEVLVDQSVRQCSYKLSKHSEMAGFRYEVCYMFSIFNFIFFPKNVKIFRTILQKKQLRFNILKSFDVIF